MRVWIESAFDNLPHEGFRRQRYWLMADAFAQAGWDVTYITSDFNHGMKSKRIVKASVESKVKLLTIPTFSYSKNVSFRRVCSHLVYAKTLASKIRTLDKPDLIIVATPPIVSSIVMLNFAREVGARLVVDIQDAWPETFYRLLPRRFKWIGKIAFASMHAQAKRLYRDADLVTGVAERYRAIANRDDFKLFRHGIDADSVTKRMINGHTKLVYLGNLGEGYDLATVIEAVNGDSRFTLDIAGRGPKEVMLKRLAGERVRFHGYLDNAELKSLLAKCEVGIIPMRDDSWVGLPYKLGDYLAAGLEIVSSLHGECEQLIKREGIGTTYEYGDKVSFLHALETLLPHEVTLPKELDARIIYPEYVRHVMTI